MNNIKPDLLAQFAEECVEFPDRNALNMYQTLATGTAVYPGQGTALGLVYVALKGAGEAGEFAEHVGKAMRDDGLMPIDVHESDHEGVGTVANVNLLPGTGLTDERKALLIKEVGDELWYLAAKCNELDITLAEAALINVRKLKDRQERGVLRGSGDKR